MTGGSLRETGEHHAAGNEQVTKKQRMDREVRRPPCEECGLNPGVLEGSQQLDSLDSCTGCLATHLETAHAAVQTAEEVELPLLRHLPRSPIASEESTDMGAGSPLASEPSPDTCAECGKLDAGASGTGEFADMRYCTACWTAYQADEQITTREGARSDEHHTGICNECEKLPGLVQGTRQFAHLRYCEPCWDAYVAAVQEESQKHANTPVATCHECGKPGAYMMGTEVFTGSCYCIACWAAYQAKDKVNKLACASCGSEPALLKGSGEFTGSHYCMGCWCKAVDVLAESPDPETASDVESWSWKNHYDFIEVGTSDWGTITQYCAGCDADVASLLGEQIESPLVDLYYARGLAVEPVGAYLDTLPSLPNVTKVQCAMGEVSGNDVLYGVSSENVRRHQGQYQAALPGAVPEGTKIDVMWYAVSLSSVGHPHPKLKPMLEEIERKDLLESWPVEVLDWCSLCTRHSVKSVDVVQIDCEGRDCSIVRSLLSHCEKHPLAYPRVIMFEANDLTDAAEIQSTVDSLIAHGYTLWSRGNENVLVGRG